ncbi:MAG: aminotransferase class V-fold PLP-dependent enzyme, partial [Caldisericia bacterium]
MKEVSKQMIYLDYGATSWPKSESMLRAMTDFLKFDGGNPSKTGHRLSVSAYEKVISARKKIATFFGLSKPDRLIFMQNATAALNTAVLGYLKPGDRVILSEVEHNSVLRPLLSFGSSIQIEYARCTKNGVLDIDNLKRKLKKKAKLVVISHANNVNGTIQNLAAISKTVHKANSRLLVDAAQTAGQIEIDIEKTGIDLLAFTGHKSLHGPPGIGGLIINKDFNISSLQPLILGAIGENMDVEDD